MRTAVKIKAVAIFLAWLAIFAHSVIPHHHEDNYNMACNSLVHSCSSDNGEHSKNTVLYSGDPESSVCHISNFLFHSLGTEDFFPYSHDFISFNPLCTAKKIYYDTDHFFIPKYYYSASHLRAPPAA